MQTQRLRSARKLVLIASLCALSSAGAAALLPAPAAPVHAWAFINQIEPLENGDFLVGGSFSRVAGLPRRGLVRLDADGAVDAGFDLSTDGSVDGIARGPDGWSYVFGRFATIGGVAKPGIARLDAATGQLDAGWSAQLPPDTFTSSGVTAMAFDEVGGAYLAYSAQTSAVSRITLATGALDPGFSAPATGFVQTLALSEDGASLLVGGWSSLRSNTQPQVFVLMKANAATGEIDTNWQPIGTQSNQVERILLDGDSLIVAGQFTSIGGLASQNLARVSIATGQADPAWTFSINGPITLLSRTASGSLILGGTFTSIDAQSRPGGIAILDSKGALDPFAVSMPRGPARIDDAEELPGGDLLVPRFGEGNTLGGLVRIDRSTGGEVVLPGIGEFLEPAFRPRLIADGDGHLLTGRIFAVGAQRGFGVFRLDQDFEVDTGFQSDWLADSFDFISLSAVAASAESLFWVGIGSPGRTAQKIDRATGAHQANWAPFASLALPPSSLSAVAYDPSGDHVYLAGGFNFPVPGTPGIRSLARFSPDGSGDLDLDWNPNVTSNISHLAVHDGFLYVGGIFSTLAGVDVPRLARVSLDASAAVDATWRPAPPFVQTLLIDAANGVIYTSAGERYSLADGTRDDWNPLPAGDLTEQIALDASGRVYAVGTFPVGCNNGIKKAISIVPGTERIDSAWAPDFDSIGAALGVTVASDRIVLAGSFQEVNGEERLGLAGLAPSPTIFSDGMGDAGGCLR